MHEWITATIREGGADNSSIEIERGEDLTTHRLDYKFRWFEEVMFELKSLGFEPLSASMWRNVVSYEKGFPTGFSFVVSVVPL